MSYPGKRPSPPAALLACLIPLLAGSDPAYSQPVCMQTPAIVQQLQTDFGERLLWSGEAQSNPESGPGPRLDIFVSPDGGTWTMLHTMPNGLSCLVASGQKWSGGGLPSPKEPGRPS